MRLFPGFLLLLNGFLFISLGAIGQVSGEIDPTFKTSKSWGSDGDFSNHCAYSQRLPDGKWIVSGEFTRFSGHKTRNIARLHSNGMVDTTFTFLQDNVFLKYISLCPDGSYIGSSLSSYLDCSDDGNAIIRIKANGDIVDSLPFQINFAAGNPMTFAHTFTDGKVLLKVGSNIILCNSSGTIDTTFSILEGVVSGPLILDGEKFLIIGSDHLLKRYFKSGLVDTSFLPEVGSFLLPVNLYQDFAGRILVSGDFFLRLHPNGTIDSSFGFSVAGDEIIKMDSQWVYTRTFQQWGQTFGLVNRYDHHGVKDSTYSIRIPNTYEFRYALGENGN